MNVEEFVTNNYIRFYKAKYILKKMLEISMFMKVLFHKKLDFIYKPIYILQYAHFWRENAFFKILTLDQTTW